MSMQRKTDKTEPLILRKCYLLRLVNKVYHISVVITMIIFEEGGAKLYKKFQALLDKTNKTAYQVSKETGISQPTLSDWKNGRSKPKFDKLLLLAKYFGVPVEYFADEEKEV